MLREMGGARCEGGYAYFEIFCSAPGHSIATNVSFVSLYAYIYVRCGAFGQKTDDRACTIMHSPPNLE